MTPNSVVSSPSDPTHRVTTTDATVESGTDSDSGPTPPRVIIETEAHTLTFSERDLLMLSILVAVTLDLAVGIAELRQ